MSAASGTAWNRVPSPPESWLFPIPALLGTAGDEFSGFAHDPRGGRFGAFDELGDHVSRDGPPGQKWPPGG